MWQEEEIRRQPHEIAKLCLVILGVSLVASSIFLVYVAVVPSDSGKRFNISPSQISIFATFGAVLVILFGGSCVVCGFFGCPNHPASFRDDHSFLGLGVLQNANFQYEDSSSSDSSSFDENEDL